MSGSVGSAPAPPGRWASLGPWVVALVPAAAWFGHLNLSYLLVPASCRAGHGWWLVAVTVPPAVAAIAATARSWRSRRCSDRPSTDRAAALTGVLLGPLFLLAIATVGLSSVVVDPCR